MTDVYKRQVPVEEIVASVEAGIRGLPRDQADEIRLEAARALKRAAPPKCNLLSVELRALRDLRRDDSIVIVPADKGSATVVLNTEDYQRKIEGLLDPATYRRLTKDSQKQILW